MCGIADYTAFITREIPAGRWGVLSFDLKRFGGPLTDEDEKAADRIWHGIPDFEQYSAGDLLRGLQQISKSGESSLLWFQHENGIWRRNRKFISMLRQLNIPKVVTLHTLHFQSSETPSGLTRDEHEFLGCLLPEVDAITVFSNGVFRAVANAFPQHRGKVYVLKHGLPSSTEASRLSRKEAKEKLNDYLIYESDLSRATKEALFNQRILLNPDTFVIGETGFLCSGKQSELLFSARDTLAGMTPNKRIVALRIGAPRDSLQTDYAAKLRQRQDMKDKFLIETCLPEDMLRVAQRALDVNFYWPERCTQSGIIAHAIGAGAVMAGRDLEGSGEMLKEAGAISEKDMDFTIVRIANLLLNPELGERMEDKALKYASRYSWANQAQMHWELATHILEPDLQWLPVNTSKKTGVIATQVLNPV
jgi:glycosyltransferase involved in cell wall biosynthesis